MHMLHSGIAENMGGSVLPLTSALPISDDEAVIEFALAVSYLPVGLGRAQAWPFFFGLGWGVNRLKLGGFAVLQPSCPRLACVYTQGR
jgi:hypothetical protein